MKNYGISNDKRKAVLLFIFITSLLVGSFLYSQINILLIQICESIPALKDFLNSWEYLGLFPTQVTVFLIFNFLTWVFNKHLWRMFFFPKLLDVPDLNGTWEGGFESIREVDGQQIQTTGGMQLIIT